MRILHLDSGREMRGGQWQVLHLLRGLQSAGRQVVLLSRSGAPLYERARAASHDVRPLRSLTTYRLSRDCDLIHAHDARSHSLAAIWAGSSLVVSRRVAFPIGAGFLSQWKYRRPARFIAISEAVQTMLTQAGVSDSKVTVIPDGVEVPESAGYGPDGPIVAIRSADPLKRRDLVVAAARSAGVQIDFSTDLTASLQSARCFVYISEQEGLGSAALMAMAAGIPVIASRVGGLPEIVRHEEAGLLTENSVEAIAGAIRRLDADPALAARLGSRGRALVMERYTIQHMVQATMEVYEQVLQCQKR